MKTRTEIGRMRGEKAISAPQYKDEHYTPAWVYEPLGPFDTDPCAGPNTISAVNYDYSQGQDGLLLPWEGIVWCNPPYSLKEAFLQKMRFHVPGGFVLLPNSTDTVWWQQAATDCDALLLLQGRISFLAPDGRKQKSNTKGSTIFAYGPEAVARLRKAHHEATLLGYLDCK